MTLDIFIFGHSPLGLAGVFLLMGFAALLQAPVWALRTVWGWVR